MPRPKSKAPKAPHLSVAVTEEQLRHWNKAAEETGLTLSAWVRFMLDEAADNAELDRKGERLTGEQLRKQLAAFNERMLRMIDGRGKR